METAAPAAAARARSLVGDGAWGTLLMERGLEPGASPESLNLTRPEVLAEIAALYLEAGAEIITTNTFGGSPLDFAATASTPRPRRSTAPPSRRCAERRRDGPTRPASVGPSGQMLKPYGDAEPDDDRRRASSARSGRWSRPAPT